MWGMDLSLRNALYTEAEPQRIRSRDLFGGSYVVKQKGKTYLFQGKNEKDEHYEVRLKRAVLDNYVEKIVRARQAVLFMRPPTRELDASLGVYEADVDTKGTAANTFFRDVSEAAQVDGLAWVLVDMPKPVENPVSRADETRAGIRPFMQYVPAASVIDWSVGGDGMLDWLVISQFASKPRTPGVALETAQQYKVWYRDRWELFQIGNGAPGQSREAQITDSGPNASGRVPLVPFYGAKAADYLGLPVCASVLDHIILAYNKTSDLDWFESLSCHPIPWVISAKNPELLNVAAGMWIESVPQINTQIGYLQTSGDGENSVRSSIEHIEGRIYAIALAQAKRDGKQVQAADSQREDRRIFTSALKSVSEQLEASEKHCWELMALWMGAKSAKADVTYNRDFDDRVIDTEMLTSLNDMVDGRKLSIETLLNLIEYADLLPGFNADEEKKRLASEATTRAVELVGDMKKAGGGA